MKRLLKNKLQINEGTDSIEEQIIESLKELLLNREEQLNKESYRSFNYGFVAGQISGVEKAIQKVNNLFKHI